MHQVTEIIPAPGEVVKPRLGVLYGLLALIMSTAVACSTLGLPAPESFNDKVAIAKGTVTSLRMSATALLNSKTITSNDGTNVLTQTDAAAEGIKVAQQMRDTACPDPTVACTPTAAENRLKLTVTVLTALQLYLDTRKAGH